MAKKAAKKSSMGKGSGALARGKAKSTRPAIKTPLSKAESKQFRQMLLEKRRDLLCDMNGIAAEAFKSRQKGSGDLSNMPTHLADLGTDNYEQEFTLGLLENERNLLKEIDEALERIEKGTYGVCLGTGKFIGKARLQARPWAKYCIEYARMLEKGQVRAPQTALGAAKVEEEDEAEVEQEQEGEEPEGVEEVEGVGEEPEE